MKTLKGQNFRATITTASQKKYFAGSQSCTVHVVADLEEVSTKDSTNGWKEQEVVAMSWDGSVNGLVIMDADTNAVVKLDALDMVGSTLDMTFEEATGEKNRQAVSGGIAYEGKAIMNDGSFQFDNKANSTYTLQFTGNGELKKKSSVRVEIWANQACTEKPVVGTAYTDLYAKVNTPLKTTGEGTTLGEGNIAFITIDAYLTYCADYNGEGTKEGDNLNTGVYKLTCSDPSGAPPFSADMPTEYV